MTFSLASYARMNSLLGLGLLTPARLSSVLAQMRAGAVARVDSLVLKGWEVYARDTGTGAYTFMGFIPGDAMPKEIVDFPLPDGAYEIEARPSEWFWQASRGRRVATLITDPQGGGPPITGFPVVQHLRRDLTADFKSRIKWEVVQEVSPSAFKFGLWFGPAPGVDTSGPPDATVRFQNGQGAYEFLHTQVAQEYVAVAPFTPTQQGEVAEILLAWDLVAPPSPANQHADPFGLARQERLVLGGGEAVAAAVVFEEDGIDGGHADTVYVNPDLDGGLSDSIFDGPTVDGGGA